MARQVVIELELAVRKGAAEVKDLFGNLWTRKSSLTLDREAKIDGAWRIIEANRTGTAHKEGLWYDSGMMRGTHLFHNVVCNILGRLGDKEEEAAALAEVASLQVAALSKPPTEPPVDYGLGAAWVNLQANIMNHVTSGGPSRMVAPINAKSLLTTAELNALRVDALKDGAIHAAEKVTLQKAKEAVSQTLARAADENGRLRAEMKEHVAVIGRLTIDNEKLTRALAKALSKK